MWDMKGTQQLYDLLDLRGTWSPSFSRNNPTQARLKSFCSPKG